MSELHFDEPKHGHRLPHDPFKGLSNGVRRVCPVSLTGSVLRAPVTSTCARKPSLPRSGSTHRGRRDRRACEPA